MAELLGRPQAVLDSEVGSQAIHGRRVLVTGAGGTIGSELVRQIAALRPSQLVLIDSSEFNLYSIDLELQENHPDIERKPVLCSIRQRPAVMQAFAEPQIGRAHVCTPVTNANLVCRLLTEKKHKITTPEQ